MRFNYPMYIPSYYSQNQLNLTNSGSTGIDASGEKNGWIAKPREVATLHKIHLLTGNVTANGGGGNTTVEVSFQGVDATTGAPDGVKAAYRTFTYTTADDNTLIVTGILSSDGTDNGTKFTTTAGQHFAVVFEIPSFSTGDVFRLSFTNRYVMEFTESDQYAWHSVSGKLASECWCMAIEKSDGTFLKAANLIPIMTAAADTSWNSGSNPVRRGFKLNSPFSMKIQGVRLPISPGSGAVLSMHLYDSDGKTLITSAVPNGWDTDIRSTLSGVNAMTWNFSPSIWINAGKDYYFYCQGGNTTNSNLRVSTLMGANYASLIHPFTVCSKATQHSTNDPTVTELDFLYPQFLVEELAELGGPSRLNLGFY